MQKQQALVFLAELKVRLAQLEESLATLEESVAAESRQEDAAWVEDGEDGAERAAEIEAMASQDLRELEDALDLVEQVMEVVETVAISWKRRRADAEQARDIIPRTTPDEVILSEEQDLEPEGEAWDGSACAALPEGSLILGGQYRLERLLHQRPRVHLYLARRLISLDNSAQQGEKDEQEVAIRELVLTGLAPEIRAQVEEAAFQEYVSPILPGSLRVPGAGERVRVEGERHYLVMQLEGAREDEGKALPLVELLSSRRQWPSWLDIELAVAWAAQLCRIVARLHRLGVLLGDLDAATVLVDSAGVADWPPALLVSWPPAPQFWPDTGEQPLSPQIYDAIFPIAEATSDNAFAALETLPGSMDTEDTPDGVDERADVYSLGAILYLLLTHYAPMAAARQLPRPPAAGDEDQATGDGLLASERMPLIAPSALNDAILPDLENIVLRALALDPAQRYQSAFELVEALEAVTARPAAAHGSRGGRSVGSFFPWLKNK